MDVEATIRGVGIGVGQAGTGAPAVVLEADNRIIPIFVDQTQARTIERARKGEPAERPMTHDLFAGVLEDTGFTLERVRIDALEEGTFHAKLEFNRARNDREERFVRDARPSDGLALAVRLGCPVVVAPAVIEQAGRSPQEIEVDGPGQSWGGPLGEGVEPRGIGRSMESEQTPTVAPDDPHIDVTVGDDRVRVVADMPGVTAEAITLTCDSDRLEIAADTENGGYQDRMDLPARVDPESAEAVYNNHLLVVRFDRSNEPATETVIDVE